MTKLDTDRPRRHHYAFAHVELREAAFRFGAKLVDLAGDDRLDEGLRVMWEEIVNLPEAERQPAEGLSSAKYELPGHDVALIRPPVPEHAAEAYLVAMVVPRGVADTQARYVVLEHAWTVDDQPTTVLGEWRREGHVNHASGLSPKDFLDAVRDLVSASD